MRRGTRESRPAGTVVTPWPAQTYPALPLRGAVEILLDRWGIPHIYAGCEQDAFFAQGFNAARDRLWQMDLWRRQGLGLLSEALGPGYIARDRAARLFLYRGPMEQEWAAYGCELKAVIEPFVAGLNSYVALIARRPDLLPAEFRLLGYQPATWQSDDVLKIRGHGRYRNVSSEVTRALILRDFGPEAEALRVLLEPDTALTVPAGLDLSLITADILRDYDLATAPLDIFSRGLEPAAEGSNNWAIAGRRTASGRPILASDPHRAVTVPSLRYLAHIVCPGLNIIGGGEPVLPGISIGHNGKVAFGLTVLPVDQEDLYVYETDAGGSRYKYGDGWEPMEIVCETIAVRGGAPVDAILKFTRHGPVVHEAPDRGAAFSVRAAWLQPGMAPYVASIALMRSGDWAQFRAAAGVWGSPGENLLYADVQDNIAWRPAALVPVRPNWDGLLPVPGDGRYEWDGFLTTADLPVQVNPACGWLATANERNVYPDQVRGVQVGFEWEPPFRLQRIREALGADRLLTVADSAALQNDYLSLVARSLSGPIAALRCADPLAARGAAILSGWDCRLEAGSAAAALFEVWFRSHLRPALLAGALAEQVPPGRVGEALELLVNEVNVTGDARIDLALVSQAGASPQAARQLDSLLESSLVSAMSELAELLGPDPAAWQWGALHRADLEHPLRLGAGRLIDEPDRLGPQPRGGCGDTVGSTTYGAASLAQTGGATLRMVLDVGDWDNSLAMNSPGQSGDPASPHYADLLAAWARDESIPLLYSRLRIEAATERRLLLTPVNALAPGG